MVCVADALFKQGDRYNIVEVDKTQTMKKNGTKIKKYRILRQRRAFGMIAPKLILYTTSEYRRNEFLKLSEGLKTRVFTLADFNA